MANPKTQKIMGGETPTKNPVFSVTETRMQIVNNAPPQEIARKITEIRVRVD